MSMIALAFYKGEREGEGFMRLSSSEWWVGGDYYMISSDEMGSILIGECFFLG